MLRYIQNDLYIENVKLETVAKKFKTAAFVYSKKQLTDNFLAYKEAFGNKEGLICFACKTNSNGRILNILSKLGAGADTTSGGEIF
ncbi:MAG: diaminopimelate decarboxylase, partial [Endomicrobia bacterium]|nr:diaminopimelate decarboxylase [Endomicrobiia bacterium]